MLELGMMVNNEDNDDIKTIQKRVVNFGKLHKIILPLLFGFSRDDNWLIQFTLRNVMYASKTKNRIILTKQSGRPLKLKVVIRCRKK